MEGGIGKRIIVLSGKYKNEKGHIRYHGEVEGKALLWYGVELDNALTKEEPGKYFTCKPGHAIFLRDRHVKIIDESPAKAHPKDPKPAPASRIPAPGIYTIIDYVGKKKEIPTAGVREEKKKIGEDKKKIESKIGKFNSLNIYIYIYIFIYINIYIYIYIVYVLI